MTFGCGHGRTPENSIRNGTGAACRLCSRIYKICRKAERGQKRLNAGLHVDGRIGVAAGWL